MRNTAQKIYKKTYKYKSIRRAYNMRNKKDCVLGIEELVEIVNQIEKTQEAVYKSIKKKWTIKYKRVIEKL